MKKFSTLLLIATAFLFACNNSDSSKETEGTTDSTLQSTPPPANADGSVQASSTDNSGAMTTPPAPAPASMPPPAPQQVATAPGMNPPHGQPGHRCDIAVGAPLNSPPATPGMAPTPNIVTAPGGPVVGTPQVISAPPPPSAAPAAPTTTAPGMNPPHGQPGHDCAVAVGAPLPKK